MRNPSCISRSGNREKYSIARTGPCSLSESSRSPRPVRLKHNLGAEPIVGRQTTVRLMQARTDAWKRVL
jgi:hypothetical protein